MGVGVGVGDGQIPAAIEVHAFFIRTSKFWPSLVVLKFLHNLSINCS